MKFFSLLLAIIVSFLSFKSALSQEVTLPLHINLGATNVYTATDGTVYLPDQAWSFDAGHGYMDGQAVGTSAYKPIGGTADAPLYMRQRRNIDTYIVDTLPAGEYAVTLHFAEISAHGPNIAKFDLWLENNQMLSNFDLYEEAGGRFYATVFRYPINVSDGALQIRIVPTSGDSHLAALSVEPYTPEETPPVAPSSVQVIPSFDSTILNWDDGAESDLLGYHVYRSSMVDGPFRRINSIPLRQSRYIDQFKDLAYISSTEAISLPSQLTWFYQVSTIDLEYRESERSAPLSTQPLSQQSTSLPIFQLEISEENWKQLNEDIEAKVYVPAKVKYRGEMYDAKVRYRGNFTLGYAKKSWKIVFTDDSPLPHSNVLNLKSHYDDVTLIRGPLTMKLYENMGVPAPKTRHALLFINDEYYGVYTDYEQIDEEYLARTNQNSSTLIYETRFSNASYGIKLPSNEEYQSAYELKTNKHIGYNPLIDFVEGLSNTSNPFLPQFLNSTFNIRTYLKYYAGVILTSNFDFTYHNVYLTYDPAQSIWDVVAWDPDFTWGHRIPFGLAYYSSLSIDAGTRPNSGAFNGPNYLLSRIMQRPEYKAYFCQELAEQTKPETIENQIYPLIDAYHGAIQNAARGDWRKYGWEDNTHFDQSTDGLKNYATQRAEFLQQQMQTYCPASQSIIRVNEVVGGAQGQICDPDEPIFTSCFDQWFELYNPGLKPIDLRGLYITTDLANPTQHLINETLVISPTSHLLFWADNEPQQGTNHTNFVITNDTSTIGLFDSDGSTLIDKLDITERGFNVAQGKYPDGADEAYRLFPGTPNGPNRLATTIRYVYTEPSEPAPDEEVTVVLRLFPDTEYQNGYLHYSLPTGETYSEPLTRRTSGTYSAPISPQPDQTFVQYHIEVQSNSGDVEVSPANAPSHRYEYLVGYQLPTLSINELRAVHSAQGQQIVEGEVSWIEIYNSGELPIDLSGMYLSDDPQNRQKYRIPSSMIIPGNGYTVFYANATPELSNWHTNFVLRQTGGAVYLRDTDDNHNQLITSRSYADAPVGGSFRACVNNSTIWTYTISPTPGYINFPACRLMFMPFMAQ
ncbi:MAG: CotH kinase family protein [Chloroflexota bacterium]